MSRRVIFAGLSACFLGLTFGFSQPANAQTYYVYTVNFPVQATINNNPQIVPITGYLVTNTDNGPLSPSNLLAWSFNGAGSTLTPANSAIEAGESNPLPLSAGSFTIPIKTSTTTTRQLTIYTLFF